MPAKKQEGKRENCESKEEEANNLELQRKVKCHFHFFIEKTKNNSAK